ncbi:hypothetical protein AAVH_21339 [Aphelenchoides avenae]|nr:hypothetical protein AAVH_21339 [Aphelenchus avenae]
MNTSVPAADLEECIIAVEISESTVVRLGQVQEIAGSIFGIAFLLYYVVHHEKMPRMPQRNVEVSVFQIALWWLVGLVLIHNVFHLCVYVWQQALYLSHDDGCDLVFVAWQCLLLRVPTISCVFGITGCHVLLTVDRIFAMAWPRRYRYEPWVAIGVVSSLLIQDELANLPIGDRAGFIKIPDMANMKPTGCE